MKKAFAPLLFASALAVISHLAVIYAAPGVIMDRAMSMLSNRGIALHGFTLGERTTPQTQTVVRPSPDLAYSACLFDFEQAPAGLRVKMASTENYASLSFFDASTNNFQTIRGDGSGVDVRLLPPKMAATQPNEIGSPSNTGIILIRRLAPTEADYERVAETAKGDKCSPI